MSEKLKKEIFEWIKVFALAIVFAFIITQFIKPTLVRGDSMYSTLEEGDYLIINRMSYKFKEPEHGDIIVFESDLKQDDGSSKDLVKRVIGVGGDKAVVEFPAVPVCAECEREAVVWHVGYLFVVERLFGVRLVACVLVGVFGEQAKVDFADVCAYGCDNLRAENVDFAEVYNFPAELSGGVGDNLVADAVVVGVEAYVDVVEEWV